jgi:hypothetical protein
LYRTLYIHPRVEMHLDILASRPLGILSSKSCSMPRSNRNVQSAPDTPNLGCSPRHPGHHPERIFQHCSETIATRMNATDVHPSVSAAFKVAHTLDAQNFTTACARKVSDTIRMFAATYRRGSVSGAECALPVPLFQPMQAIRNTRIGNSA